MAPNVSRAPLFARLVETRLLRCSSRLKHGLPRHSRLLPARDQLLVLKLSEVGSALYGRSTPRAEGRDTRITRRESPLHRLLSYLEGEGRVPIALTSGLAVTPRAITLSSTVQLAASMIVSLPGSFPSRTIVASPRGP